MKFSEIEPGLIMISASGTQQSARYSYLLQQPRGNILLHGPDVPAFYDRYRDELDKLGGFNLQLLTHKDEASRASVKAWRVWDAPLRLHALEEEQARRRTDPKLTIETFDKEPTFSSLKAYWLPGHSAGFTAYRYKGKQGTYLFTGDLIWRRRGDWVGSGHAGWYRKSLERMARIGFDYLMPNKGNPQMWPPIERSKITSEDVEKVLAVMQKSNTARKRRIGKAALPTRLPDESRKIAKAPR